MQKKIDIRRDWGAAERRTIKLGCVYVCPYLLSYRVKVLIKRTSADKTMKNVETAI